MAAYTHNANSLMPLMTGNALPTPVVISPSSQYSTPTYSAFHLCDRDAATIWFATGGITTGYIKINTGGVFWSVTSYTVTGCTSVATCSPRDWTLQASNDEINWTTIDTRTGETGWSLSDMRTYTITAPIVRKYYKMVITANDGYATLLGFSQLELIGTIDLGPSLIYIPFRGRDRFYNWQTT